MSELKSMLMAENKADKFLETFKSKKNFENLNSLSLNELYELNKMVIATIKSKRINVVSEVKMRLNIGDVVRVSSKKVTDDIFEVVKLNPKKAVVKNELGQEFVCPYSLIIEI